jgi:hypothetical protein
LIERSHNLNRPKRDRFALAPYRLIRFSAIAMIWDVSQKPTAIGKSKHQIPERSSCAPTIEEHHSFDSMRKLGDMAQMDKSQQIRPILVPRQELDCQLKEQL